MNMDKLEKTGPKIPKLPEEFEALLLENKGLIMTLLRPYRGLDDYEDLMQEAYIGFYKGIQAYNPSRGVLLTTFAYSCARNQVKMYLRKSNTKSRGAGERPMSLDTGDGTDDYRPDSLLAQVMTDSSEADADDEIYKATVFKAAIRVINEDLDRDSRIVVYRFLQGVSQSKTATEISISQAQVSKLLKRAIERIREELKLRGVID